jgi:lipopolysaccharide biosynthesis glycosyltransferase
VQILLLQLVKLIPEKRRMITVEADLVVKKDFAVVTSTMG